MGKTETPQAIASQPVRMRNDYGEKQPEAAMLKMIPLQDYDEPVVEEEVKEVKEECTKEKAPVKVIDLDKEPDKDITPVQTEMRDTPMKVKVLIVPMESINYDEATPELLQRAITEDEGKEEKKEKDEVPEVDEEDKVPELECPGCSKKHTFDKKSLKEKKVLKCPECGEKVATTAIYKTASHYRAVVAKCMDPHFKAIRDKLGEKMSGADISSINKHLDVIYKKYRELEKAVEG